MKKITFYLRILASLFLIFLIKETVVAQEEQPPFWEEIQSFKSQDKENPPAENAILLFGSSSFAKWKDVSDYFPKHTIINRGFGGSTFADAIRYVDDIVFPYKPKQIVIYEGDNDAVNGDDVSGMDIFMDFKKLYHRIREELPEVDIVYISIKPSPSRKEYFPVMDKANWEIQQFIEKEEHSAFVDVWHEMLDDFGQPREELFGPDLLHMNEKGYTIWQKIIEPHLLD